MEAVLLAREAAGLIRKIRGRDEEVLGIPGTIDDVAGELEDRLETIEKQAGYSVVETAEGACFLLHILHTTLQDFDHYTPDTVRESNEFRRTMRAAERLFRLVEHYLNKEAQAASTRITAEHYLAKLAPHSTIVAA